MIEVLFGESEAGSMKAAKSDKILISKGNGVVSQIGNLPRHEKDREENGIRWVPGNSREVICLGFLLDIGNIQEPADSLYRQELILNLFMQNGRRKDQEEEKNLRRGAELYAAEQKRLLEFAERGEPVRIWYSEAPYSMCGLYYTCSLLRNRKSEVSVVRMPDYRLRGRDTIICDANWGDVCAEDFSEFLTQERKLSAAEIRYFSSQWAELVSDNSPLRAVVNGTLTGVPEEFYDFLIRKMLPEEPVKEARLIGSILGHFRVSIGDWWYAARIEKMIGRGEIRVVLDAERSYDRVIERVK